MEQKRSNRRPQKLDTQGIRNLVLALTVSSTIGFWALFSRLESGQSAAGDVTAQTAGESQLMAEAESALVNLPPIPTLIPTLDPSIVAPVAASGLPLPSTIGSTIPTPAAIQLPGTTKERSGSPEKTVKQKKRKATTTSTQSSK
jgi:hypothetical protein